MSISEKKFSVAHAKSVRGVAVDALTMEVYSGSGDRTVKVGVASLRHMTVM